MAYPTNPIYKFSKNIDGVVNKVMKVDNGITFEIPFVDGNTHYESYKEWVAEGNTAEAAD
tara:strand:- start:325 stop:504 length:180 start_codon:yes stop_codon:yes gene_type:complete